VKEVMEIHSGDSSGSVKEVMEIHSGDSSGSVKEVMEMEMDGIGLDITVRAVYVTKGGGGRKDDKAE
jgi:hypothetical protein